MSGWTHHQGQIAILPLSNIDTDQIIPARFMSQPREAGYGSFLMYDLRRDASGKLDKLFPINSHSDATILIAGDNFGCGSSREAAVYALVDAGFKAIFSTGFGDIFSSNAVNNGLLTATLNCEALAKLRQQLVNDSTLCKIDLANSTVTIGNVTQRFQLDTANKQKLIQGWDDIDMTQQYQEAIKAFQKQDALAKPWKLPTTMFNED